MTFENKFKNPVVTLIKTIIVVVLLMLALVLTCYMIFYFQSKVNRLNRQYPEVNWENVIAHASQEMLMNSGMFEYYNYEVSDKSDLAILMQNTDNLQCFWDQLVEEDGYINAMNKEFDVAVFGSHITGAAWNDYLKSAIFIQLTGILLPCMIILFNLLLKTFAILLVRWMKFENKTKEIAFIQSVVFLLMFFNSALSILLINTNIPNLNPKGILFNGLYSDFSDDWYDKISQFFITPMFIQLIFPLNAFLPDYIIQKTLAILDRGFSDPKLYKTKWKIAYDYAELNSGTEHLLFEKYPRLLNIIFVSAFYGFSLPLLPILIFVSLIISYIFDKIVVALYHRKPPLYDETLNVISIHLLKWAAFLYIAISYWVLTNNQMFGNDLKPIEYQAKIEDFGHKVFEIPDKIQQKILLFVALAIFLYLLLDVAFHLLHQWCKITSDDDVLEFEDLQPFHKALDDKSLKFWVNEERHIRQRLGYKYLFDSFYQKLRDSIHEMNSARFVDIDEADFKDYIWDSTNYDYLYQPFYSNQYAYIPVYKRKNKVLDNESNFTRKALDFPYHQQNSLSFYEAGMIQRSEEEEKKQIEKKTTFSSIVV